MKNENDKDEQDRLKAINTLHKILVEQVDEPDQLAYFGQVIPIMLELYKRGHKRGRDDAKKKELNSNIISILSDITNDVMGNITLYAKMFEVAYILGFISDIRSRIDPDRLVDILSTLHRQNPDIPPFSKPGESLKRDVHKRRN